MSGAASRVPLGQQIQQGLGNAGAYVAIFLLWLLHFLPLPLLAALGHGLAWVLWRVARSRRKVAMVNLGLCFPELSTEQRVALGKEHFVWLTRSLLERCLLWFASNERLLRMVRVEGDITRAERTGEPVMWLLPHFVGLDFTAPPLMLLQKRPGIDVYQRQSNPVMDAWLMRARARFGPERSTLVDRSAGIRPVIRAIHAGAGFVNAPDQDFGRKDSAFLPFFGVPASTLLAPARMARSLGMMVQPIIVTMLPGGQGYVVKFCEPPPGFDDPDPEAAAAAFNRWLEARIREHPAQYLWVHRRFKTRPEGEPYFY
jgi:KDO2-lipid IV(A) lauroyltransferase